MGYVILCFATIGATLTVEHWLWPEIIKPKIEAWRAKR